LALPAGREGASARECGTGLLPRIALAGTGSGVSSVIANGLAQRLHDRVRPTNNRFCIADIGNGSPHRGQAM
jgi:hypothetical protein